MPILGRRDWSQNLPCRSSIRGWAFAGADPLPPPTVQEQPQQWLPQSQPQQERQPRPKPQFACWRGRLCSSHRAAPASSMVHATRGEPCRAECSSSAAADETGCGGWDLAAAGPRHDMQLGRGAQPSLRAHAARRPRRSVQLACILVMCIAGTISPCLTQENTKAESFVSGRAIGRTLLQYQPAVPLDPIRFQTGHSDTVFDVACSPTDPSVLASGSSDYTVQLWNVKTLERLGIMSGHAAPVSSVAFNPNGTLIASADTIGIVKIWDVASRSLMHTITTLGPGLQLAGLSFSPDGAFLAGGSSSGYIIGRRRSALAGGAASARHAGGSCTQEGHGILKPFLSSGSELEWTHHAWLRRCLPDVGAQDPPAADASGDSVDAVAAIPASRSLSQFGSANNVVVWSLATRTEVARLAGHMEGVTDTAFAPGERSRLASSSSDGTVRLWETRNWRPVGQLSTDGLQPVSAVAWAPDGVTLAGASNYWMSGSVSLWDTRFGRRLATMQGHSQVSIMQPGNLLLILWG
mmetsp:Transcript_37635/g.111284  ORF Transcript_37635/g.111284 Transcript_37635/m.111284 type:complete len:522 (-) Transcript_37635:1923-3488(-)